jgi:rod shape-determining protein MreD
VSPDAPQLTLRLGALAFVTVILQSAVVGQLHIFGVPADITPLVVMAVGLLLGSTTGAAFGFGVGLLLDLALLQTLGVSSLLLTVIGYGAGRLRELRDPAHGLVPMGVGAGAAATFVIGSAAMQFLLGFDVPISPLLVRDIVLGILLDTLIAIPVHNLVRRLLLNFLPDDPRRRRRRAYTTGGLSPLSRS